MGNNIFLSVFTSAYKFSDFNPKPYSFISSLKVVKVSGMKCVKDVNRSIKVEAQY